MIPLLLALLACGASTDAWDVSYKPAGDADVDSVKEALDELYVRCRTTKAIDEARSPLGSEAENLALRVQVLELKVQQLETVGLSDAGHVTYDPTRTTLASKSVQDALTELENRVAKMAADSVEAGVPGEGLFEIRDGPTSGQAGGGGPGAPGGQGRQLPPNTMGKSKGGGAGGQGAPPGGGQGAPPGGGPGGGQGGGPGGGQGGGPGGGQPPPQP